MARQTRTRTKSVKEEKDTYASEHEERGNLKSGVRGKGSRGEEGKARGRRGVANDVKSKSSQVTKRQVVRQRKRKSESNYGDSGNSDLEETQEIYNDTHDESESEHESDGEEFVDSDALDEDDNVSSKKRKRQGSTPQSKKKNSTVSKKSKKAKRSKLDLDDSEEDELNDGQEIVGSVVQAPKTGRVPPGQISQNTFNFLTQLKDPSCNDRTWFKLHEPVYRQAEKEWKDFIEEFTPLLTEADEHIPVLPPNDVVHRIYRDIRFSNDKTPYKTNFSASFSRSGRKGIFAGYHLMIKPGGSLFAAGTWCPGRNELQTIRNNLLHSSRRLRQTISAPDFVELFGKAEPHPKGKRQNVFGAEDELKVAPKGVDKTHKDIDLLKCRSYAVVHYFEDKEVLDPDFKEEVKRVVSIARPFVHTLNELMTISPEMNDDDEESEEREEE